MAVRIINSYTFFRSAASPPLAPVRSCFCQFRAAQKRKYSKLGFHFRLPLSSGRNGGSIRSYSVESLFDSVLLELAAMRKNSRVRASNKLSTSGELLQDKLEKTTLQKGLLLEFKKDSERVLLAVAQKPDGKKNWMVLDENGSTTSIKPQQITFIVPGIEDFDHSEISEFIKRAETNLDPSLLEFAWVELLEKNKSVTVQELAEMIFGCAEPLESYCAHILLSKDDIYFIVLETKGPFSIYGPRPAVQVKELLQRKLAKEAAEKEFQDFIHLLQSAKGMPQHSKPPKASWRTEDKVWHKIEALESYAIDDCRNDDQKKTAGMRDVSLECQFCKL